MEEPPKKKSKVDYGDINLDDYLNIDLKEYKKYLYLQKRELVNKISLIEEQLKEANILIGKKCEKENGSHEWITERESGPYGSKYTFCKNCKIDIYDNSYFHYL